MIEQLVKLDASAVAAANQRLYTPPATSPATGQRLDASRYAPGGV